MQSVSSKTWTRITVSISYDDNHYTTGTSMKVQLITAQQSQSFKKFCFGYENLNDQEGQLGLEAWIPRLCLKRILGKLSVSQPSVVHHLYNLRKSIQSCQILHHVTKILQNLLTHPVQGSINILGEILPKELEIGRNLQLYLFQQNQ